MNRSLSLGLLIVVGLAVGCGDSTSDAPEIDAGPDAGGGQDRDASTGECDAQCDPVASCNDATGSCVCPAGYDDIEGDGTVCDDVDECAASEDDCDAVVGVCSNTPGGFTCSCPDGYDDVDGDGTRCAEAGSCDACDADVGVCNDDGGTFTCTCPTGYDDVNDDGSACEDIDECATDAHDCDAEVGACTNTAGGFTCACPSGYDDVNDDGTVCSNIDECDADLDDCDEAAGVCTDSDGSFTCACPSGYDDVNGDGTLCSDIDECADETDDCDDAVGICTDEEGGFACACPAGYDDVNDDGTLCTDIDECADETDDCDEAVGICTDEDGSFSCACPAGYDDANDDGTLCEPLDLYYASAFQNLVFQYHLTEQANGGCRPLTLPMFTITGINSMTPHPVTGVIYAILKVSGGPRRLATIDLETAEATDIGSLGDNFASLAFSTDGATLYGVTGDGATVPETLYSIDIATAERTLVQTLGNGADGEMIAFAGDGTLYHWSGNSTVVTETIQIGVGVTPISSGPPSNEIFGATWWGWRTDAMGAPEPAFLLGTISSNFRTMTTAGVYSTPFGALPDDPRGPLFAPDFDYPFATTCPDPTP